MIEPTGYRSPAVARFLTDIRDHFGAAEASIWILPHAGSTPHRVVGTERSGDSGSSLTPRAVALVGWVAEEEMTHLEPAGPEIPFAFGAARISQEETFTSAVVITAGAGFSLIDTDGRRWLERHARTLASIVELLRHREEFERGSMHTRSLLSLSQVLPSSRSLESLSAAVCAAGVEITTASHAAIVRWDDEQQSGSVVYSAPREFLALGTLVGPADECGRACVSDIALIREAPPPGQAGVAAVGSAGNARSLAIIPIKRAAEVMGAMVFESDSEGAIRNSDARSLKLLAHLAAGGLETVWELANLTAKADRDALTGLLNRRAFDRRFRALHGAAERGEGRAQFSLLMVDIDHFKRVNDTIGHQGGDAVLVAVSAAIDGALGADDICARYGGEEFAVLLPGSDSAAGQQKADALRSAIEGCPVGWNGGELAVTISVGVAAYPASGRTRGTLVSAADSALYRAKNSGRNRVSV